MIIEINNVSKIFDSRLVLDNIQLQLYQNKIYCLIGKSGCGKTTLLRMMNGMTTPDKGSIFVMNENLASTDTIKLRRKMGYVIQGSGLFPHLTVLDNLTLIAKREKHNYHQIMEQLTELLDIVHLPKSFLSQYPFQLSGGEKQRVSIVRAFLLQPRIVLMDEPFSALDYMTRTSIYPELLTIQKRFKMTICFVTHDLLEAFKLSDEIILFGETGKIEQIGPPQTLRLSPRSDYVTNFLNFYSPEIKSK